MKIKYKLLIDLCNSYEKTLPNTITEYGFITPKSYFVDHIIKTLTKKDKNFPKREFLKQVKCSYRHGLVDIGYKKQHEAESKKQERKQRKEERKAEKEKEKMLNDLGYNYDYYGYDYYVD